MVTTDHETIRAWVEERGGRPTRVRTGSQDGADLLRIDFGEPDPELEPISWDAFFNHFEEHRLAFLYQTETKDGEESRFSKFVYRNEKKPNGAHAKEDGENDDEEDELDEDDDIEEEDEGYDADPDEPDEM